MISKDERINNLAKLLDRGRISISDYNTMKEAIIREDEFKMEQSNTSPQIKNSDNNDEDNSAESYTFYFYSPMAMYKALFFIAIFIIAIINSN